MLCHSNGVEFYQWIPSAGNVGGANGAVVSNLRTMEDKVTQFSKAVHLLKEAEEELQTKKAMLEEEAQAKKTTLEEEKERFETEKKEMAKRHNIAENILHLNVGATNLPALFGFFRLLFLFFSSFLPPLSFLSSSLPLSASPAKREAQRCFA